MVVYLAPWGYHQCVTTAQVAPAAVPPSIAARKGKTCSKCREYRMMEEFTPDARNRDGHRGYCKTCENKGAREKRELEAHKAKLAASIAADTEKSSEQMVVAYHRAGYSFIEVSKMVEGYTPADVQEAVTQHRMASIRPDTREFLRQKELLRLERIAEEAEEKGDLKEARLTSMDILRAAGIITQGGPAMKFEFNSTYNVLEERLAKWEQKNEVEGVVVDEPTPQLPASAADTSE